MMGTVFSAWQDVPSGTAVPTHPSDGPNAVARGLSEDFADASIASDMAGDRSRIFASKSPDGLPWDEARCVIEGAGYAGEGLDAVHAEDMLGGVHRRQQVPDVLHRLRQGRELADRQRRDRLIQTRRGLASAPI
jgi:hypothetical protein